ncbi:TPA: hypothetical protein ACP3ZG_000580 [Pseudomonas aeruginosa]|uniref:Uncharacterized protein n=1 Tax=Pseudomonas aeruginosa TaxID=287 RepID=A0A241XR91_PSEAI|nr:MULTISPECIES: hypothetical protein [Pseudomonas]ELG7184006.1 hypothetical protein [Pseudomonas aeruginosa]MBI6602730.1 hypothetical protein [Pseudomonas sp. S4_EA_1b]MBI8852257.1 hypothetical protein [Pseudomonas aeruginosa]OBY57052.1 hypothetical protein A9513_016185 [Pseudomonas sp. AU12215]OTI63021.1 hypothetical protein CAZ10_09245 [Pseudomonas aeruginosa]
MQRRTFVSGLLLLGGGLAGHYLTSSISGAAGGAVMDPKLFAQATSGLKLQYLSQEMLLKIFSRQVAEADRRQLVAEIINHNRNLFVKQAYERQHGVPGFYRVIE